MTAQNKIAVVTGGSKGIGRAISLALAEIGYHIAILDPLEKGREVVREIAAAGGKGLFFPVDVSQEREVLAAAAEIGKVWGTPAVLVNNAGIYPRSSVLEMPLELWNRVIGVNLTGTFLCSRAFAAGMLAAGGGVIVNIASGRGLQGTPRGAHYAASKAGIISLTRTFALEWAPAIRVNAVIPGVTDTDQPREEITDEKELYDRGKKIPLGRIGQPEDIAKAVCFLVGDQSSYMTGQSVCVNGGAIMP